MKQKGTRYGFLLLLLSLAFTLICSGSIYAQDLFNYNLNGNDAPGTIWNATTISGGQIYRGDGAWYNPAGPVAPCSSGNYTSIPSCQGSATQTAVAQCSYLLSQVSGTSVTASATATAYVGGFLNCNAIVNGYNPESGSHGSPAWVFAGDWTNYYSLMNAHWPAPAESETTAIPPGELAPSPNVQTEQCMDCHHPGGANRGGTYLLTGHKNGFRKIVSGEPLHSSDGSTYTGINWTTVPPVGTSGGSNGLPVYYNIAGWMSPGAAPDIMYYQGASAGCAYCHVSGYNPVAPINATLWGGTDGLDGFLNWSTGTASCTGGTNPCSTTYPGPEPTQVLPVTGVSITGVSIATAGVQAPVVFTTSVAPSFVTNAYVQVNGFTTATGTPLNGTIFQVSGVSGTTFTATSTIPYSYYAATTGTVADTATMSVLSPLPQTSSGVLVPPENASSGFSSWYLTGVTCERCHIAEVGTSTLSNNNQYNAGHEFGSVTGAVATPVIPSGQGTTALCMQCHRLQVVSSKGAQAITPLYPPVVKYSASTGAYSDGDYQGSEFLNSPHSQYLGTLTQNAQGTADLSVNFNGTYYSIFTGVNEGSNTTDFGTNDNSGCTGCHDPHQTIVGSEYNGTPLSSAPAAIQNANLLQPTTYTATAGTGVGSTVTFTNQNFGALMGSGTVQANNCDNCHGTAGPGESIMNASTGNWTINHSVGPGTMFPNSSSSISSLDIPGACMVCHMQGASGQPQKHFFRINPSATYYTYNAGAYSGQTSNYNATAAISAYSIATTNVTFTVGAFTGATAAAVGDEITVSGVTPAVLNNTYIVTAANATSFTASVVPLGSPASITGLPGGSVTGTATIAALPYNTYTPGDGEFAQASSGNTFINGGSNAIGLDVDIACGQCHGGGTGNGVNPYGIKTTGAPNFSRAYLASVAVGIHGTAVGPTLTAPTFTPPAGAYTVAQTVTLGDTTTTATICYTTNGYTPTANTAGTCDSTPVGGPPSSEFSVAEGATITVAVTENVAALATEFGATNSPVAYAAYTISPSAKTVALPTFSLKAGTYTLKTATSTLSSVLSDATSGATICYTTNGSTPTASTPGSCDLSSTEFGVPSGTSITIAQAETVMAIGTLLGDVNSGVFSATYALIPAAPTFSPGSETFYQQGVTASYPQVTLTSNAGAAILYCYVVAGQPACTPNTTGLTIGTPFAAGCASGSPPCGTTFYVNAAFGSGTASSSSHATYFIKPGDPPGTPKAATPTFSPLPGVTTGTETVTLADTSSPAPVICYTVDGGTPAVSLTGTCTTGSLYVSGGPNTPPLLTNTGAPAAATFTSGSASISATNTFSAGKQVAFLTAGGGFSAWPTVYYVISTGLSTSAFEVSATPATVATFTNGSASISATNNFSAGEQIQFATTGALPTGFSAGTVYYVLPTGLSVTAFEVSATSGGTAITAGSAGSGNQTVQGATISATSAGSDTVEPVNVHGTITTIRAIAGGTGYLPSTILHGEFILR